MSDQIAYRANLTVGFTPFLASVHGQTVIVPKQDQNVTPRDTVLSGESQADRDRGFPQAYYMHNVFPTNYGYKSIGFLERIPGIGVNTFNDIFILRDTSENKFLYSPVSEKHYIYDGTVRAWTASSSQLISSSGIVTVAYINGATYICFQGVGIFQYDTVTKLLIPVIIVGITATLINGICSSNGFLIAWDNLTVYRSQATSVLNFTSDPSLGSGSSIPNDIKGTIVCCLPIADGFIIYCTKNAVSASFQTNIQYPFIYKEVKGSGGIQSPSQVAWTANLGVHYVWSLNGLLQLNKTTATQVFPEVTDFLTARQYETFDSITNTLIQTDLSAPLLVRIVLVADRYLIISYGINSFTDALIHDLGYHRWGKVKLDHVAAFEWYQPNVYGEVRWVDFGELTWNDLGNTAWADLATGLKTVEATNEILAFLQQDGRIVTVQLDNVTSGEEGVLLLGKYQFLRDRFLVLDEISIQNAVPGSVDFEAINLYTLDGKTYQPAEILFPDPDSNQSGTLVNYFSSTEAKNHTIGLKGTFNICDLEMLFHLGGHT